MDNLINNSTNLSFWGSALRSSHRFLLNLVDTPAIILLYHRVTNLECDHRQLAVKPENFADQLEHLKKNYNMIEIEEFVHLKTHKKRFPKNSVVLTFDDGYNDNYTEVLPILETYDMSAIFFISTARIDTGREFWWDEIERIFLTGHQLPEGIEIELDFRKLLFDTSSKIEQSKTYEKIRQIMRHSKAERQEKILASLITWAGLTPEGRESHQSLNSEDIKKMSFSKSAIIGAHAHSHTQLSLYSPKEQYDEIKQSKEILESITGQPIKYFSYPFGRKDDYNQDTIRICRSIGFDVCCSNFYFQVHRWTDRFQIPRILVRDWNIEAFKSRLKMFFRY